MPPLNIITPIDWRHSLNRDLVSRLRVTPGFGGRHSFIDLVKNQNGTLVNIDPLADWRGRDSTRLGGDGSLEFDGTASHVTLASSDVLDDWTEISLSVWFNSPANSMVRYGRMIERGANSEITIIFNVEIGDNKLTVQKLGTAAELFTSTDVLADGTWHHMVLTVDSAKIMSLYIDGYFDKSAFSDTSPVSKDNTLTMGKFGGANSHYFEGKLDDLCIWTRSLDASEARAVYIDSRTDYKNTLNYIDRLSLVDTLDPTVTNRRFSIFDSPFRARTFRSGILE